MNYVVIDKTSEKTSRELTQAEQQNFDLIPSSMTVSGKEVTVLYLRRGDIIVIKNKQDLEEKIFSYNQDVLLVIDRLTVRRCQKTQGYEFYATKMRYCLTLDSKISKVIQPVPEPISEYKKTTEVTYTDVTIPGGIYPLVIDNQRVFKFFKVQGTKFRVMK